MQTTHRGVSKKKLIFLLTIKNEFDILDWQLEKKYVKKALL